MSNDPNLLTPPASSPVRASNGNRMVTVGILFGILASFLTLLVLVEGIAIKGESRLVPNYRPITHVMKLSASSQADWGDSAGACAAIAAASLALATLLYMFDQSREQGQQFKEQMRIAAWTARSQAEQLQLAATTAQLASARAVVETLWKGSNMDLADQEFAVSQFEYLKRQFAANLAEDSPERRQMIAAVSQWEQAAKEVDATLSKMRQTANDFLTLKLADAD